MKLRTIVEIAAIGGLLYAHRRRGGEWTIESLKHSAIDLLGGGQQPREQLRSEREVVPEVAKTVAEATAVPSTPVSR